MAALGAGFAVYYHTQGGEWLSRGFHLPFTCLSPASHFGCVFLEKDINPSILPFKAVANMAGRVDSHQAKELIYGTSLFASREARQFVEDNIDQSPGSIICRKGRK